LGKEIALMVLLTSTRGILGKEIALMVLLTSTRGILGYSRTPLR
jgi:hypothetical protein